MPVSNGGTDTRQVLLVKPVLNFSDLQPGQAASAAIRETARSLGLDPAHGVTVRLTGPVPLADEEFGSLAQDADTLMGGMVAALLVILWLSVRSARIVIAMLLTTFIGLVITTAIGLLVSAASTSSRSPSSRCSSASASTSPSSSAFAAVPSGSPIPKLAGALIAAAGGVGPALALSAAAISVGFFSFLPTTYIGVAELGAIAGLGMIVAFVLTIVLLPALLMVLRPSGKGMAEVGFSDAGAHRHLHPSPPPRRPRRGLGGGSGLAARCCRSCASTSIRSTSRAAPSNR